MVVLNGILDEVTVLCSDAHGTWRSFAKAEAITHIELNASKKRRVSDVYHIQNVNGFHRRFKKWLERFNGVSSKFLDVECQDIVDRKMCHDIVDSKVL